MGKVYLRPAGVARPVPGLGPDEGGTDEQGPDADDPGPDARDLARPDQAPSG